MEVTVDIGRKLRALSGAADATPLLSKIGALMVIRTQRGFEEQRRGTSKWKERGVPNIMGILDDLDRGRDIPGRRFESRPALIDTGQLRNSMSFEVMGPRTVEFGSNKRGSGILHKGGTVEKEITDDMKQRLAELLGSGRRKQAIKRQRIHPDIEEAEERREEVKERLEELEDLYDELIDVEEEQEELEAELEEIEEELEELKEELEEEPERIKKRPRRSRTRTTGAKDAGGPEPEKLKGLGFLFGRDSYSTEIPPRTILTVTKEDRGDIRRLVNEFFTGL